MSGTRNLWYSIIIAVHPTTFSEHLPTSDFRLGNITVDWIDFTREKSVDRPQPTMSTSTSSKKRPSSRSKPLPPGSASSSSSTSSKPHRASSDASSLQPLLAHYPSGPNPLDSRFAEGITEVGRGVVHLFRHSPPADYVAGLASWKDQADDETRAEGADGSLIAILAVPAWMRPSDFLEFIGGWGTCLEGVRMIREATTPNRSIVLLKFRDPLQASDFLVIFTGRAFSSLDSRETCHPIRIHHLILHKIEEEPLSTERIPAFPPSLYTSLLKDDIPPASKYELPSCPVCLERLDSTVTGLVTLPCAHTFDCDCLRKWGDSKCPVCRVSHLLLSSSSSTQTPSARNEITKLSQCSMCESTEHNWICVVCGVVGCGRYFPGKAHAREHWEQSGHVLAMELETQRVWDYKGDNYVHRLIQTRNDGKLVELPSLASLANSTSAPSRPLPLGPGSSPPRDLPPSGPTPKDMDKMSTIEGITLEYSYLLSSQLESMRQHYETQFSAQQKRIAELEDLEARLRRAQDDKSRAEREKEKAEKKAERAAELLRGLQSSLSSERSLSDGLAERIRVMKDKLEVVEREKRERDDEVKGLNETVHDLMFSLEAGMKIQENGGAEAGEGGDLVVVPSDKKSKKKGKK
ncbi:BRCA1-associated protein, partial [Tremellales sp. Uapishka_1]